MRFSRRDGVGFERSDVGAVLLDPDGLVLSSLSSVGTLIWDLLPSDLEPIVDDLAARFPSVSRDQLTADAERFLGELAARGLVADAGSNRGG